MEDERGSADGKERRKGTKSKTERERKQAKVTSVFSHVLLPIKVALYLRVGTPPFKTSQLFIAINYKDTVIPEKSNLL